MCDVSREIPAISGEAVRVKSDERQGQGEQHKEPGPNEPFSKYDGFLPESSDILVAKVTVEDAKAICRGLPGCRGFTFHGSDLDGRHIIHFKNFWELRKIDGVVWTAYKYEAPFTKHDGLLPAGGTLMVMEGTVEEAKVEAVDLPGCCGFTFEGVDGNGVFMIHFKSSWSLMKIEGAAWTSYKYVGPPILERPPRAPRLGAPPTPLLPSVTGWEVDEKIITEEEIVEVPTVKSKERVVEILLDEWEGNQEGLGNAPTLTLGHPTAALADSPLAVPADIGDPRRGVLVVPAARPPSVTPSRTSWDDDEFPTADFLGPIPDNVDGLILFAHVKDVPIFETYWSARSVGVVKTGERVRATGAPVIVNADGKTYHLVMIEPHGTEPAGAVQIMGFMVERPPTRSLPWQGPQMRGEAFRAGCSSQGLAALLERHGDMLQVLDFLPGELAQQAIKNFRSLSNDDPDWNESAYGAPGDADHRYRTYEGQGLDFVKAQLASCAPHMFSWFRGARYDSGGGIGLHTDGHLHMVTADESALFPEYPVGTPMRRVVAFVYYLTENWREEYGGLYTDSDEEGPRHVVPRFNSLVAFLVPREHYVTQMTQGAPSRYSVFGWFSEPGGWYPADVLRPMGFGNWKKPVRYGVDQ